MASPLSFAPLLGNEPDAGAAARAMAGGSRYVSPVDGTYARNGRSNAWGGARGGGRFHAGNDLQAPFGSPVVAMMDGRVVYVGFHRGYGATIDILAADGNVHRYATHDLAKGVLVNRGDTVTQGQPIGKIGTEHRAPHLHLEFIPPSSRAFKDAVEGRLGVTQWYARGGSRTIDPMEVVGASRGMTLAAGKPFSSGRELSAAESENARLAGNPFGAGPRGGVPIPVSKPALSYAPVMSMLDRANPLNAAPKLTGGSMAGVGGGGAPMTVKGEFAPPLQLGQPSMGGGGGSGSAMTVRPGAEFLPPKSGEVPALGPVRMDGSAGGGAPMLPSADAMGAIIRGWVESLPSKGAVAEPGQAPQPGQIGREDFDQAVMGWGLGGRNDGVRSTPEFQLQIALNQAAQQAREGGGGVSRGGFNDRFGPSSEAPIMLDTIDVGAPPSNIGGRFDDAFRAPEATSPQPAVANSIAARFADAFKAPEAQPVPSQMAGNLQARFADAFQAPAAQSVPPVLAAGVQARFADAFQAPQAQSPQPAQAPPWAAAEAAMVPGQAMRSMAPAPVQSPAPLGPSFMQAMANAARQSAATAQPQQARAPAPPVALEAPRQVVQADRIPVVNADPEPVGSDKLAGLAAWGKANPASAPQVRAPNPQMAAPRLMDDMGRGRSRSDPVTQMALGARSQQAVAKAIEQVLVRAATQQSVQRAPSQRSVARVQQPPPLISRAPVRGAVPGLNAPMLAGGAPNGFGGGFANGGPISPGTALYNSIFGFAQGGSGNWLPS